MSLNSSTQERRKPKQNRADEPQPKYYLLFDAGGTLVFPDQSFLIEQAWAHGVELTHEQLFSGYCRLIHRLDCEARNGGGLPNHSWSRRYAYALFETIGIDTSVAHTVARAFKACHSCKNLWTFTFDWVRETLSFLDAQGYHMSVISNSDGRTAEVFRDLDLTDYFERIFDSCLLKIEKPDPAVFELALRELNLQPADALYIGDFFEVDVRGANRAGLGALHLDPLGLYADWPGVHLPDVRHLPNWLAQHAAAPSAFDLFPTRRISVAQPMPTSKVQYSSARSWLRTRLDLLAKASNGIGPFRPGFLERVLKVSIQDLAGLAGAFLKAKKACLRPFGEKSCLLKPLRSIVKSNLDS
jgi:putative hydrolase of the HAD superfamily